MPSGPVTMPGVLMRGPPTPFRPEILGRSGTSFGAPPSLTTIRYVRKTGSDSNGGTSPSDAWLTINKALTTASPGTVIYVGAGTYRETTTVTITPTPGLPVSVVGDVSGFWTGDAGMVRWTAYTSGDNAASANTSTVTLNGKSNLSFSRIFFDTGADPGSCIDASTATSINISITDCGFLHVGTGGSSSVIALQAPTTVNWLIDRCYFVGSGTTGIFNVSCALGGGADYDLGITVQNSFFIASNGAAISAAINVNTTGSGTSKPGGLKIRNCLKYGQTPLFQTQTASSSTALPCTVYGCAVFLGGAQQCVRAQGTGQVVEDYNYFVSSSPRTNVTAGSHTKINGAAAPLLHFGQERIWGGITRPFGEPMISSALLAFGAIDTSAGPFDLRGGPRPSIASRFDVGPIQRGNNFLQEINVVQAGSNAISLPGFGFQDLWIPVDVGSNTFLIYCRYDTNYVGPLPSIGVVQGQQVGIDDYWITVDSGSLSTYKQYSVQVNATAKGFITLRLVASDTSGVGNTYFDTLSVNEP